MTSFRDMLLELPALEAPEGVTPNFENPPSDPGMALAIIIPCLTVTTLMTFLRIYVKTFIVRKWHIEDWLVPVAYLFSLAVYVAALHVYTYAPVVHQWDMTVRTVSKFLLDFHVGAIFYDATILVLKIGILLQFLRIFVPAGTKNKTYWTTWVMIVLNTIFYIVVIFVEIFACKPIRKAWDPLILDGKCINTPAAYLTSQSFNLALDLIILVWTQIIIWRLHMSVKQKLKLGALFIAGLSACIFGACSVWINVRIFNSTDQAYWGAWMALFTFPETTSGFLVFCLPVVPKFVQHTRSKLFPSTARHSSAPSGRGLTFEEGGPRNANRNSEGRRTPRSWWHITAASTSSKLSSIGSKLTGTTWTQNDSPRHSKNLQSEAEGKPDLTFLTFNGSQELDLRLYCQDHNHAHMEPHHHEHGRIHVHREVSVESVDAIGTASSEREADDFTTRPKHEHSPV